MSDQHHKSKLEGMRRFEIMTSLLVQALLSLLAISVCERRQLTIKNTSFVPIHNARIICAYVFPFPSSFVPSARGLSSDSA